MESREPCSVVDLVPAEVGNGSTCFRAHFVAPGCEPVELCFRLGGEHDAEAVLQQYAFLLIFLLPAMHVGAPLRMGGSFDPSFLRNVNELKAFWATLRPDKFTNIPLLLKEGMVETGPVNGSAVSCFSGGVDSCYTAHQATVLPPNEGVGSPLEGLVMIQGLDIPVDADAEFAAAYQRSQVIADAYGLKLHRVWTDARKLLLPFGLDWGEEFHGFPLAAALYLHAHLYGVAVIPSTYAYDTMVFPWGSNPVTDPLFSSLSMRFVHHGAAANKFGKVSVLCQSSAVAGNLRVCWEGARTDRNCGRCFKCIATQIAFILNGVENPACFPGVLDYGRVRRVALKTEVNRSLFESYLRASRATGRLDLARALECCLKRNADVAGYARKLRRRSRLLKKVKRIFKGKGSK